MKTTFYRFILILISTQLAYLYAQTANRPLTLCYTSDLSFNLLAQTTKYPLSGISDTKNQFMAENATTLLLDAGHSLNNLWRQLPTTDTWRAFLETGYDAVLLGVYELNIGDSLLFHQLTAAIDSPEKSPFLVSNIAYSDSAHDAQNIARLFEDGLIKKSIIINLNGWRVGIFAVVSNEMSMLLRPDLSVRITDPEQTAQNMAAQLKIQENVDVVVCLSQGGMRPGKGAQWQGETMYLAQKSVDIDYLISGHGRQEMQQPFLYKNRLIDQLGRATNQLGVVHFAKNDSNFVTHEATMHVAIAPSGSESELTEKAKSIWKDSADIERPIFENNYTLNRRALALVVADALSHAGEQKGQKVLSVFPREFIEIDALMPGEISIEKLLSVLNSSPRDAQLNPLIKIYLTGEDVRELLECNSSLAPLRSERFSMAIGGLGVQYNTRRLVFDRVVRAWTLDDGKEIQFNASTLYPVVLHARTAHFLSEMFRVSSSFITLSLKNAEGDEITDFQKYVFKNDLGEPITTHSALSQFAGQFPQKSAGGVPVLPNAYQNLENRIVVEHVFNLNSMFENAGIVVWAMAAIATVLVIGILVVIVVLIRRIAA